MADIAVIGAGYVGLTCAAGLASLGHQVVCADIDERRIALLNDGTIPIHEAGMADLVRAGLSTGNLAFVVGAAAASVDATIHFLCLQTPQGDDGAADLSYLLGAVAEIGPVIAPGSVVVNKSTVPVGTTRVVATAIGRDDVKVVSHPEFLREGSAVKDFLHPDRIVIGADNETAGRTVGDLYETVDAPVVYTDPESSELIKYASNAFLATKLTFVNEMAEVCEQVGADIDEVMTGMGLDRRIGSSYLKPGPGWGGSCFPKDTQALLHIATSAQVEFDFLRNIIDLNSRHLARVAGKVSSALGGDIADKRIGAWGLTFKAGTDDLRESPAIAVLRSLADQGAHIVAYDPEVSEPPAQLPHIDIAPSALHAAMGADCLVVLTEWPEFGRVNLDDLADAMAQRIVVDGRNILDRKGLEIRVFDHIGIGR